MMQAKADFNEETLSDLFDYFYGAPIGLHIAGPDGTITRANLAELELLGYGDCPHEYIGHHLAEFHSDSDAVRVLLDRLVSGESITEHEATLLRRDGKPQKVLLYANAKMDNGEFRGVRCFTFPHPEDLRPDIAEVGALKDQSAQGFGADLTPEHRNGMYNELKDFFDNGPVSMHIVGGDGLIKYANKSEFAAMGYDPEVYIGEHIARFHADQSVIDGMLEDLVGGTPLVNFGATLFHKSGSKLPVMIYSNSRMRDGSFVNTRCFTVPVPKARQAITNHIIDFAWPRNEDFGFTIAGKEEPAPQSKPNPMTLALKYIASRKRPEESLGFLARVSQTLGSAQPFEAMLKEAIALSVPFLADFVSVDTDSGHLAHVATATLQRRAASIIDYLNTKDANAKLSVASVQKTGELTAIFDLIAENEALGARASQLLSMGIRSLIISPLTIRGQQVGALTLLRENVSSRRNFGPADRALAEELARRISFAIEIERLSARA